jgi:ribosomal protein S12 methylthiotransferase accessory factor YcaO
MPLSATDKLLLERIERDFTYHAPQGDQPERYQQIRQYAKAYAHLIAELCPEGRERSLALTELEASVFWANAAIARSQDIT